MGVLKTAFYQWKREKYPRDQFDLLQIEYIDIYFQNVESGEDEQLPNVPGQSRLQGLIAEFWDDQGHRLLRPNFL